MDMVKIWLIWLPEAKSLAPAVPFQNGWESLGDTFATVKPRHEDVPPSSFGNA